MEVLSLFGTEQQRKEWLEPLLERRVRSSFAMSEHDVASSDATNVATASSATARSMPSMAASGGSPAR
jgi:acyl-CoA dehydrogenase